MTRLKTLLSSRCCGGPVLLLSIAFLLLGGLFLLLGAAALGGVFMAVGLATLGLCLWLGHSRCVRPRGGMKFRRTA